MYRYFKLIFIFVMFVSLLPQQGQAQTGSSSSGTDGAILLIEPDITAFPIINLHIVVRSNGRVTTGLDTNPGSVTVSEPFEELKITPDYEQPITTAVVVDLSSGADLDLIKVTLNQLIQTAFKEGDNLRFYLVDGSPIRAVEVSTVAAAQTVVNGLRLSSRPMDISEMFGIALRDLNTLRTNHPQRSVQGLLISTASYNQADVRTVARGFGSQNIPLYIIQPHRGRNERNIEFLSQLATISGGDYINNFNGNADLTPIYNAMNVNRLTYRIEFKTLSTDASDTRNEELTVSVNGVPHRVAYSYPTPLEPPVVEIVSPTSLNPTRSFASMDGDFTISEEPFTVQVTFPDNIPRSLSSLRLEVTNQDTGAPTQSPIEFSGADIVLDANGKFTFPWSLKDYNEPQSRVPLNFKVTVRDEKGMEASTTQSGSVVVDPFPTATPQPTYTPQPTFTPQPTARSAVSVVNEPLESVGIEVSQEDDQTIFLGLLGVIVGLLVAMVVLYFWLTRTKAGQQVAANVSHAITNTAVYKQATQIFRAGSDDYAADDMSGMNNAIAHLQILYGYNEVSTIPITNDRFIVGRELGAGTHAAIRETFVSAQHFTLTHDPSTGSFTIKDMHSSNKTFLNGKLLRGGETYPIENGDRIMIAERLEMEFVVPHTNPYPNQRPYQQPGNGYQKAGAATTMQPDMGGSNSSTYIQPGGNGGGNQQTYIQQPAPGANYGQALDDEYDENKTYFYGLPNASPGNQGGQPPARSNPPPQPQQPPPQPSQPPQQQRQDRGERKARPLRKIGGSDDGNQPPRPQQPHQQQQPRPQQPPRDSQRPVSPDWSDDL